MARRYLVSMLVLGAVLHGGASACAADPAKVQQSVEQGVLFLKQTQHANGSWPSHSVGATALVGLALLECDVPANDPAIQLAANHLREVWTSIDDHTTYSLSLSILFLDRLGDRADVPIIQALAIRLLSGQNAEGGWDYACPPLGVEDVRQFQTLRKRETELKSAAAPPPLPAGATAKRPALPKQVQQILTRMKQRSVPPVPPKNFGGDNSNTQFAVLALWVARRHGVPVERALALTASRFRSSQHGDGGWAYVIGSGRRGGLGPSTASMTCAGLLGLALGYGSAREATLRTSAAPRSAAAGSAPASTKDSGMRLGLAALGRVIGLSPDDPSLYGRPPLGDSFYLLWSIERVAVAYDLPTIGKRDWYEWGSSFLLGAQQADGSWQARLGPDVDTSFALLFLRRANLSRDLTVYLKGIELHKTELKASVNENGLLPELGNPPVENKPAAPPTTTVRKPEPAASPPKPAVSAAALAVPSKPAVPDTPAEAARLGEAMVRATGRKQEQLLDQLKQGKGGEYTNALASAIGRLQGEGKNKARDALAERLTRMTPATLRDKLQDEEVEIRRAAALACAMKENRQFVGDLIPLLKDRQTTVARAAHAALKALTGQDLGPADTTSADAGQRAAAAWEQWWKDQKAK